MRADEWADEHDSQVPRADIFERSYSVLSFTRKVGPPQQLW